MVQENIKRREITTPTIRSTPIPTRVKDYDKRYKAKINKILGEELQVPVIFDTKAEEEIATKTQTPYGQQQDIVLPYTQDMLEDIWLNFYTRVESVLDDEDIDSSKIKHQIRYAMNLAVTESIQGPRRDPMTLLLTKGAFLSDTDILIERLKKEEEESDKEHIMIYFDVDEFKTFNDQFGGRGTGDRIILETARLLKSIFRIDDLKARISGDEFAVLVPSINFIDSLEVLKRAMLKLYTQAPTATYDGKEKKATFSIVAVTISPKEAKQGVTAEQILLEADRKSKIVKDTGKSGFLIMSAAPNSSEQSVVLGRFDPVAQQFTYQSEQIATLESMRKPNIRA